MEIQEHSNPGPSLEYFSLIPPTILIVEDDVLICDILDIFFKKMYTLVFAHNYDEAKAALDKGKYAAALVDINLGAGKTGIDLVQDIIRANPDTMNLPVIVSTAYEHSFTKEDLINKGFTDVIFKPAPRAEIVDMVAKYTNPSRESLLD